MHKTAWYGPDSSKSEPEKKETGIQALFGHSLILLLLQVSELNWAFVSWGEREMVGLWLLRFIPVLKFSP